MPEQCEQQNDRQRDAEHPKQCAPSKAHNQSPLCLPKQRASRKSVPSLVTGASRLVFHFLDAAFNVRNVLAFNPITFARHAGAPLITALHSRAIGFGHIVFATSIRMRTISAASESAIPRSIRNSSDARSSLSTPALLE